MYSLERVEFYLPPLIPIGEDVIDAPSIGSSQKDDVDRGTTTQTAQGSAVSQPTDDGESDKIIFSFGASSKLVDVTDSRLKSFQENVDKLPAGQKLMLSFLVEDINEGSCKLDFCEETRKVIVHDIRQESKFAARIPEFTLKIRNKLKQDKKQVETEEFCNLIDRIKQRKPPAGVVQNDNIITLGPCQSYREGKEFFVIPNYTLGKGLQATIQVSEDKGSTKQFAQKSVMVNNFQSNEIRAMVALKDYRICPELYACYLIENNIVLHMEILDNHVTLQEVVTQLAGINPEARIRFDFALYILRKLSEIVCKIHDCGWFHCDLHSGNVMIERTSNNDVSLKVIDFGNAQGLTESTESKDKVYASKSDFCNMLKQFCSLVLLGEWFKDLFDFEQNFHHKIVTINDKLLPSDLKERLLSIIQNGLSIKAVFDREEFISKLPGHSHNICPEVIFGIVAKLDFRNYSKQTDTYSSPVKSKVPEGSQAMQIQAPQISQTSNKDLLQSIKNLHL